MAAGLTKNNIHIFLPIGNYYISILIFYYCKGLVGHRPAHSDMPRNKKVRLDKWIDGRRAGWIDGRMEG